MPHHPIFRLPNFLNRQILQELAPELILRNFTRTAPYACLVTKPIMIAAITTTIMSEVPQILAATGIARRPTKINFRIIKLGQGERINLRHDNPAVLTVAGFLFPTGVRKFLGGEFIVTTAQEDIQDHFNQMPTDLIAPEHNLLIAFGAHLNYATQPLLVPSRQFDDGMILLLGQLI